MIFWLLVFIFVCGKRVQCQEILVESLDPEGITEGDTVSFQIRLELNETRINSWNESEFLLTIESSKGFVDFGNDTTTFLLTEDEINGQKNLTVSMKALTFGYESVIVHLCRVNFSESLVCTYPLISQEVELNLLRKKDTFDLIFIIVVSIVMIVSNINMGCFLDIEVLRTMLKKPKPIIIGFGCQYLYMPLGSYVIGRIFSHDLLVRLGFFVLGCCPGSVGSNSWTLLFRGDVNLSVVMTFVSTVTSFAMMPLWIFTLGREFFILGHLRIPYVNLVSSLLIFVLPVGIGMLIKKCSPRCSELSKKIIRPYTIVVMIFFLTIGIYANLYLIRLMTWKIVASGAAIAWGGYLVGGVIAHISCLNNQQVIAVAIETALQNPAIAFVLMKVSLPPPSDDIGIVSPVAQLLVAHIPLWLVYIPYIIQRRIKKKKQNENEENNQRTEKKSKSLIELKSLLRKQPTPSDDPSVQDSGNAADEELEPGRSLVSKETKPEYL